MKLSMIAPCLAIFGLAGGAALGAPSDTGDKSVCIRAYQIDHTEIPDDNTILFYMQNHKVWRNTLVDRCVGLKNNTRGFTYSPTNPGTDEICSNLQTIRVNDTGQTCLLGAFTPVDKSTGTSGTGSPGAAPN
jgi:hypothetical protein